MSHTYQLTLDRQSIVCIQLRTPRDLLDLLDTWEIESVGTALASDGVRTFNWFSINGAAWPLRLELAQADDDRPSNDVESALPSGFPPDLPLSCGGGLSRGRSVRIPLRLPCGSPPSVHPFVIAGTLGIDGNSFVLS
jgi:hypothetical protein